VLLSPSILMAIFQVNLG